MIYKSSDAVDMRIYTNWREHLIAKVSYTSGISICQLSRHTWSWINFTWFGANESDNMCNGGAKARQLQKSEWFCIIQPQAIARSFSFLTDSSVVLCSASVLVTTDSKRWHLQPSQVVQVVQVPLGGTSICAVARRFAVSPSTVSGA